MNDLPNSAKKVQIAAENLGLEIEIVEMAESTRTAQEAAAACGCSVGQIVKSLVFRGADSGLPYLLLVSGDNRVNERAVAGAIGETLKRPDARYVRDITGFAIGGIPPFGHTSPLKTFVDADLLRFETVWAAAGTPRCVMELPRNAFQDALGAKLIAVK